MIKQISYAELYLLLSQAGVAAPLGVDAAHFPLLPDGMQRQKVFEDGRARLAEREDDVQKLVQVLVEATAVMHVIYRTDAMPDQDRWYYTNGTEIVRLQANDAAEFGLVMIADKAELFADIHAFLPLLPAPEDLNYRIKIDHEEFMALFDMASEMEELPTIQALEADGLDIVLARDLYDSATGSEWRGIITFQTYQGETVTAEKTIRALQGAELAWLIRPSADGNLVVETARAGLFQTALRTAWDNVSDAKRAF